MQREMAGYLLFVGVIREKDFKGVNSVPSASWKLEISAFVRKYLQDFLDGHRKRISLLMMLFIKICRNYHNSLMEGPEYWNERRVNLQLLVIGNKKRNKRFKIEVIKFNNKSPIPSVI
jgi:hypothetical protein